MAGSVEPDAVAGPDVRVDADLARALVRLQHPDLGDLPIRHVGTGWDNAVFRLGPELCIRLPRRELAAGLVCNEVRWLPELDAELPLPIPAPVRAGEPALGYPWMWSICRWLPGETALLAPPAEPASAARTLGGFLRRLHRPAPPDAPKNPYRGVPLAARDADVRARLSAAGADCDAEHLLKRWREALAAPTYGGPAVWVHGDLHPANIIVREGEVAGIIDFGDLCAGDPAVDFAVGWMLFDDRARDLLRRCGGADAAMWRRAQGWALVLGLALVANLDANSHFAALGARTLRAAGGTPAAAEAGDQSKN